MSETNKNTSRPENRPENTMDGGPVVDSLNSDNAFSDKGLENARLLEQAVNNNGK